MILLHRLYVIFLLILPGCATETAWSTGKAALVDAASDPETWIPAATAVALGVSGLDNDLADWASDETPIFGSQKRAEDTSDLLRDGLTAGMVVTAVFSPIDGQYQTFPGRRLLANGLAYGSAVGTVNTLKAATRRERPDGSNRKSFPSGHTVKAFTSSSLLRQNLGSAIDKPILRTGLDTAAIGAAALTGWARIEAGKHYATDVLASVAIGNFFAKAFHEALAVDESAPSIRISAEPDGFTLNVSASF